jgi:hypothetical protein
MDLSLTPARRAALACDADEVARAVADAADDEGPGDTDRPRWDRLLFDAMAAIDEAVDLLGRKNRGLRCPVHQRRVARPTVCPLCAIWYCREKAAGPLIEQSRKLEGSYY